MRQHDGEMWLTSGSGARLVVAFDGGEREERMGELVEDPLFGEKALQEIVGEKLSAVTFVMDYVQLAFDGPMINAYTWPTVQVGDRLFRRGDPSYRDELCARVAIDVVAARAPRDAIEIAFADGSTIRISLRAEEMSEGVPEAAEFNGSHLITFGRTTDERTCISTRPACAV